MLRQAMPNGDRGQAQYDRQSDICQGSAPRVGTDQIECLQAERGEGGESATDPHHDKEADVIGGWISAAVQGKRPEVADDKRADHVDENGTDGKANTDVEGEHQFADCEAQESAERTTDHNPEIRHRLPRSSSWQRSSAGLSSGFGRPHSRD